MVEGDDLMPRHAELAARNITEMNTGEPWPEKMMNMNAYLGAEPIKEALDMGADIVITGRVVDSALTLGPLMHEFGWSETDYDLLAAGSLAGHIIECGAQASGGLFTDWQEVPDWANIGYPVIECYQNGRFVVTKPVDTGGLVIPGRCLGTIALRDRRSPDLPFTGCGRRFFASPDEPDRRKPGGSLRSHRPASDIDL